MESEIHLGKVFSSLLYPEHVTTGYSDGSEYIYKPKNYVEPNSYSAVYENTKDNRLVVISFPATNLPLHSCVYEYDPTTSNYAWSRNLYTTTDKTNFSGSKLLARKLVINSSTAATGTQTLSGKIDTLELPCPPTEVGDIGDPEFYSTMLNKIEDPFYKNASVPLLDSADGDKGGIAQVFWPFNFKDAPTTIHDAVASVDNTLSAGITQNAQSQFAAPGDFESAQMTISGTIANGTNLPNNVPMLISDVTYTFPSLTGVSVAGNFNINASTTLNTAIVATCIVTTYNPFGGIVASKTVMSSTISMVNNLRPYIVPMLGGLTTLDYASSAAQFVAYVRVQFYITNTSPTTTLNNAAITGFEYALTSPLGKTFGVLEPSVITYVRDFSQGTVVDMDCWTVVALKVTGSLLANTSPEPLPYCNKLEDTLEYLSCTRKQYNLRYCVPMSDYKDWVADIMSHDFSSIQEFAAKGFTDFFNKRNARKAWGFIKKVPRIAKTVAPYAYMVNPELGNVAETIGNFSSRGFPPHYNASGYAGKELKRPRSVRELPKDVRVRKVVVEQPPEYYYQGQEKIIRLKSNTGKVPVTNEEHEITTMYVCVPFRVDGDYEHSVPCPGSNFRIYNWIYDKLTFTIYHDYTMLELKELTPDYIDCWVRSPVLKDYSLMCSVFMESRGLLSKEITPIAFSGGIVNYKGSTIVVKVGDADKKAKYCRENGIKLMGNNPEFDVCASNPLDLANASSLFYQLDCAVAQKKSFVDHFRSAAPGENVSLVDENDVWGQLNNDADVQFQQERAKDRFDLNVAEKLLKGSFAAYLETVEITEEDQQDIELVKAMVSVVSFSKLAQQNNLPPREFLVSLLTAYKRQQTTSVSVQQTRPNTTTTTTTTTKASLPLQRSLTPSGASSYSSNQPIRAIEDKQSTSLQTRVDPIYHLMKFSSGHVSLATPADLQHLRRYQSVGLLFDYNINFETWIEENGGALPDSEAMKTYGAAKHGHVFEKSKQPVVFPKGGKKETFTKNERLEVIKFIAKIPNIMNTINGIAERRIDFGEVFELYASKWRDLQTNIATFKTTVNKSEHNTSAARQIGKLAPAALNTDFSAARSAVLQILQKKGLNVNDYVEDVMRIVATGRDPESSFNILMNDPRTAQQLIFEGRQAILNGSAQYPKASGFGNFSASVVTQAPQPVRTQQTQQSRPVSSSSLNLLPSGTGNTDEEL